MGLFLCAVLLTSHSFGAELAKLLIYIVPDFENTDERKCAYHVICRLWAQIFASYHASAQQYVKLYYT